MPQHDHGDAGKRRGCGEEGADRAEQFRRVDLADPMAVRRRIGVKGPWRGIDPEIKPDCAGEHHQQQKALRGQGRDAGADERGDK